MLKKCWIFCHVVKREVTSLWKVDGQSENALKEPEEFWVPKRGPSNAKIFLLNIFIGMFTYILYKQWIFLFVFFKYVKFWTPNIYSLLHEIWFEWLFFCIFSFWYIWMNDFQKFPLLQNQLSFSSLFLMHFVSLRNFLSKIFDDTSYADFGDKFWMKNKIKLTRVLWFWFN